MHNGECYNMKVQITEVIYFNRHNGSLFQIGPFSDAHRQVAQNLLERGRGGVWSHDEEAGPNYFCIYSS